MAVSFFYNLLKENEMALDEALRLCRDKRYVDKERGIAMMGRYAEWEKREEEESPFYYKKFGDVDEYYGVVMRMAG